MPQIARKKTMFSPTALIQEYLSTSPTGISDTKYRGSIHFDHLYAYTQQFSSPSDMVSSPRATEQTALWITSYLAHWGMFRGSSKLGDLNIIYFKDLLRSLLSKQDGILNPLFGVQFEDIHCIDKRTLDDVLERFSGVLRPNVSPTATLISKLTLGLTSSLPGYDRNFIAGLKKLKDDDDFEGPVIFGANSLTKLSAWYSRKSWPQVPSASNPTLSLPSARLIDMAIFKYGEKER